MALEDILATLRREAEEQAARILAQARESAGRAREEARAQAEAWREQMKAETGRELDSIRLRRLTEARLLALRALREEREAWFQRVFARVRARLEADRDRPGYVDRFTALKDEALEALPEPSRVRVDPRDASLAPDAEPTLVSWGGVELEAADGRIVRNTLEERLARAEPELRRIAAHALGLP